MCVQIPFQGVFFEFINQFTIMQFQLIAVEYAGLQFTKGVFNPKPKRGWTLKLKKTKAFHYLKINFCVSGYRHLAGSFNAVLAGNLQSILGKSSFGCHW